MKFFKIILRSVSVERKYVNCNSGFSAVSLYFYYLVLVTQSTDTEKVRRYVLLSIFLHINCFITQPSVIRY